MNFAEVDYQLAGTKMGETTEKLVRAGAKTFSEYANIRDKKRWVKDQIEDNKKKYTPTEYPDFWKDGKFIMEEKFSPEKNKEVVTDDGIENFSKVLANIKGMEAERAKRLKDWQKTGYRGPMPSASMQMEPMFDYEKQAKFWDEDSKTWTKDQTVSNIRGLAGHLRKQNPEISTQEAWAKITDINPNLQTFDGYPIVKEFFMTEQEQRGIDLKQQGADTAKKRAENEAEKIKDPKDKERILQNVFNDKTKAKKELVVAVAKYKQAKDTKGEGNEADRVSAYEAQKKYQLLATAEWYIRNKGYTRSAAVHAAEKDFEEGTHSYDDPFAGDTTSTPEPKAGEGGAPPKQEEPKPSPAATPAPAQDATPSPAPSTTPAASGGDIQEFEDEAAARAGGKKTGDIIKIKGVGKVRLK